MPDPDDPAEAASDLRSPFIFVPHGDPEPLAWMVAHPGWVKFPATMVPRAPGASATASWPTRPADAPPVLDGRGRPNLEPPTPAWPDPYDPMNPYFDPVATLRRLGYPLDPPAEVTPAQWLEPLLESPLSKEPEDILPRYMERIPGQSGKEAADDTPSFAKGKPRLVGETPEQYARRVMDDEWGPGQWKGLPERDKEFRQIKKYGSRGFRVPRIEPLIVPDDGDGV